MRNWSAKLLVLACILLLFIIVSGHGQSSRPVAINPTCSAGRYEIYFRANIRADTFLLDSETGRIWSPVSYTNLVGEPDVWRPVDRVDNDIEMAAWVSRHTFKAQEPH